MEPVGKLYTCAQCGESCLSNWSEEAAESEYYERFGHLPKEIREERQVICDYCYRKYMQWMRKQWLSSGKKATLKN